MRLLALFFLIILCCSRVSAATLITGFSDSAPDNTWALGMNFHLDSGEKFGGRAFATVNIKYEGAPFVKASTYVHGLEHDPLRQARVDAWIQYVVSAHVTQEFVDATGAGWHEPIPLLGDYYLEAGRVYGDAFQEARLTIGGACCRSVRSGGGPQVEVGTFGFLNAAQLRLDVSVYGSGPGGFAFADPFIYVDPTWQYSDYAHLIDIRRATGPEVEKSFSVGANIPSVPLPTSMPLMVGGFLAFLVLRRRVLG